MKLKYVIILSKLFAFLFTSCFSKPINENKYTNHGGWPANRSIWSWDNEILTNN
jgi:hypothetical protein